MQGAERSSRRKPSAERKGLSMDGIALSHLAIWSIAAAATGGVIVRPWGLPEAIWAALGAAALVMLTLLPWRDALLAVAKGTDVYLFLTGMMLLAELARREGLFDRLAVHAAKAARGSGARLFGLVYLVGVLVTAFLSNDATAVVLTPAVFAAAKAAKARPHPYLVACAMIANAASFVLPISNPANLVLYGNQMPPLWPWLKQFALPSLLSIAATYAVLRWLYRNELKGCVASEIPVPGLSNGGRYAAYGIGVAATALLLASAYDIQLGLPTFAAGAATALFVLLEKRESPWPLLRGISWGVLPLVAGLFVLVEGLNHAGAAAYLTGQLHWAASQSAAATAWIAGASLAFITNLMNNLPAGLIAQSVLTPAHPPAAVTGALLIGVDLGPNLSITGSLATILWLLALRREGESCTAVQFLKIGAVAMPAALLPALAALILTS
jgi:arsenical pump membrane protein